MCVFAGTTERVCLIQGTVEALNGVHDFIAEKVREMPQSTQKTEPVSILQPQTTVNPDRVKQVSLTVCSILFYSTSEKLTATEAVSTIVCVPTLPQLKGCVRKTRRQVFPLERQAVCVYVVELQFSV